MKDAIAERCGFLPREMIRYMVDAEGDDEDYMEKAVAHFKFRGKKLMSRDTEASLKFSAYIYMHCADWKNMPSAWKISGVLHEATPRKWKWVCEAAKDGFFSAFRESSSDSFTGVLGALTIFSTVNTTHGQALELALIHAFNKFQTFAPGRSYTDLQGKSPGSHDRFSFDARKIKFIQKGDRDKLTELEDGTAYVLWEGAAVVDFFAYHSVAHYAWIQLSKSKYSAHRAKAEDMFHPAQNYPVNEGKRNGQRHSPYSYFRRLIKPDKQKKRTEFDENEYYFYLTPNEANPQRQLTACEKKNVFLIGGQHFKEMLGPEIADVIRPVFETLQD